MCAMQKRRVDSTDRGRDPATFLIRAPEKIDAFWVPERKNEIDRLHE